MADPVAVTRVPPLAKWMTNGYRILIVFSEAPDVAFAEVSITPPGILGGDSIKTTNQLNEEWHTKAARILKELTDTKVTAMWIPDTLTAVRNLVNKEQTITLMFPTDPVIKLAFFGYLRDAKPGEFNEHSTEPPMIELDIVATMCDPLDLNRAEAGFVLSI